MATKRKIQISNRLKETFFSSQGLPLSLAFITISILFVLFRMKGVELDYKVNEVNSKIEKHLLENKELKAKKAKMLSTKNLRHMASKHSLKQPTQKQIIVVP
ncbi:MAG: cell division protein FtsL [Bacteriovoracaceae bacterium]|jgi:cell division protein FtsL